MKKWILSAAMLLASPSVAATYLVSPAYDADLHGSIVINFDPGWQSAASDGYELTGTALTIGNQSQTGVALSPGQGRYGYVSGSSNSPRSVVLTTPDLYALGFLWGSIDAYNSVTLLGQGGADLLTVSGADLGADGRTNKFINFTAGLDEVITGLRFVSTGVAFEFDQISTIKMSDLPPPDVQTPAVPEPSTWAMLILGFGLIGLSLRTERRRTQKV